MDGSGNGSGGVVSAHPPCAYNYGDTGSGSNGSDEEKYQREYGAEIDTRFQDLTFEQDEVSDEEDLLSRGVRPGKQSNGNAPAVSSSQGGRTGSGSEPVSASAISVLKEVLMDLISKEARSSSSNSGGGGGGGGGGGNRDGGNGINSSHGDQRRKVCMIMIWHTSCIYFLCKYLIICT